MKFCQFSATAAVLLLAVSLAADGHPQQQQQNRLSSMLVERLKALDKGIRQGLHRPSSGRISTTPWSQPFSLTTPLQAKTSLEPSPPTPAQEEEEQVQLLVNEERHPVDDENLLVAAHQDDEDENQAPTSDVVRQLTEDQPLASTQDVDQTEMMTSKEGDLSGGDNKQPPLKPTKYHFYPHNQHLYLLPECATQQVCNAVYTRFNLTQPLCACADRFQGPCSASIGRNDRHTIEVGLAKSDKGRGFKSPTLVKTCEETAQIRDCRAPQDWALLALQNVRTGKSQYLVICRCHQGDLDGPMSHDQPAYARVPGIRVYGMMCNSGTTTDHARIAKRSNEELRVPEFPWHRVRDFTSTLAWD